MPADDKKEAADSALSASSDETAAVRGFYDSIRDYEWSRLDHYVLEHATVRHYLERFLPPPPARILDIGGGPGRYALMLAQAGYDVTLVDLSPRNVEWATEQFRLAGVAGRALLGDARDLGEFAEADFDAALLMGPLYHLPLATDRAQTLQQVRRAMRADGVIFSISLTRAAAIYEGFNRWPEGILDRRGVEALMTTGSGFNFERNPHDFEGVYHASVAEVVPAHEAAGFQTLALAGCEAMLGGRRAEIERMAPDIQAAWIELALRTCEDTSLLGAAERLLYVGAAI